MLEIMDVAYIPNSFKLLRFRNNQTQHGVINVQRICHNHIKLLNCLIRLPLIQMLGKLLKLKARNLNLVGIP